MNWRKDSWGWESRYYEPKLRIKASPQGFYYSIKWRRRASGAPRGPYDTPEAAEQAAILAVMALGECAQDDARVREIYEHVCDDMFESHEFTPHKRENK